MRNIRKGFSLVELVVVLAVIGLIAAIAVPTYSTVRDNAAKQAAVASAESLASNALVLAVQLDDGNGIVELNEYEAGMDLAKDESAGTVTYVAESGEFLYTHPNTKQATITFDADPEVQSYSVAEGDQTTGS